MKKLFVIAALVGLFLVGCQDASMNPVSPGSSQISTAKSSFSVTNNNNNSVTQTIDGSKGGVITFTKTNAGLNGVQSVSVNLTFAPGAFEGVQDITVATDFNDASFSFYPHMVFDNSKVTLNANYTGVNLTNLNLFDLPKIDFYYLGDDGSKELIKNNGTKIDLSSGSIGVKNAKLPHFSRYGWAT